ncbi:hypothetical protein F5Y11DRAFT_346000 [Daldinia sp. FL1419]|nr:hypothetical protein F5Y11DRAFT_346000 [Daldinia sp. FL1419]
MTLPRRQKWIDVYDPETGHHQPQLGVDRQPSGQISNGKLLERAQEKTIDNGVKLQKESAPDIVDRGPSKPRGLSQSRWAPKEENKSIQQLAEGIGHREGLHEQKDFTPPAAAPATATTTIVNAAEESSWYRDPADTPTKAEPNAQKDHELPSVTYIEPSDSNIPCPPRHTEKYVKHWVKETHEIIADLHPEGVTDPEKCDVDTETGRLMAPMVALSEVQQMSQEDPEELEYPAEASTENLTPEELPKREYRNEEDTSRELLEFPLVCPEKESNPREIRVPCHLRPAKRDDMMQVAALYNEEVHASYKLLDKRQVGYHKWLSIYDGCCTEKMPFFVAVDGWYNKAARNGGPVVGFAVMDVAVRGIFGSYKTHAAPCGKLTVVVHPKYRRKNVCSVLLDAVFTCCSTHHTSRRGYEFINENQDRRYMTPEYNLRQWSYIDIEAVIPSGSSKEEVEQNERFKWLATYLSKYFDMSVVYHDEKLYRDDRYVNLWLDRITFRHQCRPQGT